MVEWAQGVLANGQASRAQPLAFVRPTDAAIDAVAASQGLSAKRTALLKKYLDEVHSGEKLEWGNIQPGLTYKSPDAQAIRQFAREHGLVPEIQLTPAPNNKQPYANFAEYATHTVEINNAGVFANGVKQRAALDKTVAEFYRLGDDPQFARLNQIIGGKVEGYTWHHHQNTGVFELVPTGLHQVYTHSGGRSPGHWAFVPGLRTKK